MQRGPSTLNSLALQLLTLTLLIAQLCRTQCRNAKALMELSIHMASVHADIDWHPPVSHVHAGVPINTTLLRFQYPLMDFGGRLFQGEQGCSPSSNNDFLMVTQMVSRLSAVQKTLRPGQRQLCHCHHDWH